VINSVTTLEADHPAAEFGKKDILPSGDCWNKLIIVPAGLAPITVITFIVCHAAHA